MNISRHAQQRCQDRGVRSSFVGAILRNADVDRPIGGNCRLLRVSRNVARDLNLDDRLGRYALIWSETNAQVVTVLPMKDGRQGARYRKSF